MWQMGAPHSGAAGAEPAVRRSQSLPFSARAIRQGRSRLGIERTMAKRAGKPSPQSEPDLAFESRRFMQSDDARALRILAEYLEPQIRLRRARVDNTVVFFGSARILPRDVATAQLSALESRERNGGAPAGTAELKPACMAVEMARYY